MKGGYVHDKLLLQGISRALAEGRASVVFQQHVRVGQQIGYCDIAAQLPNGRRIVIEIEMTNRRVANDVRKAIQLDVDELWILVPNRKVRYAAERRLKELAPGKKLEISVLTLPGAIKRLKGCFPPS